ncbi:hypothetical protein AWENTII_011012 [Aspergillus wentii]
MMDAESSRNATSQGRPYRSHVYPACLPCKKRKSRCKTKTSGICIMCQAHGTDCVFPYVDDRLNQRLANPVKVSGVEKRGRAGRRHLAQRGSPRILPRLGAGDGVSAIARVDEDVAVDDQDNEQALVGIVAESGENSSHVVSPAVADDNNVLESYLSAIPDARRRCLVGMSSGLHRGRPVLFNSVLRRPLGVNANQSLAAIKCELIEKYIEPDVKRLVDMFFACANVCFPIFDEASFQHVYCSQKEKISPALLCNLYANAQTYWHHIPNIRRPDNRFIWNQANEALHSELFLSPGISTVMAIILNVCGRPSTSIFGNGGMVGLAVALSNALGLNRDPSNWNISPLEKKFRIRIWWLIVVHDRWCSLAYGTPLQIHRKQYDVPLPTLDDICPPDAPPSQIAASSIFIALTSITEVLSRYLEHIYTVSNPSPNLSALDLEQWLNNWEESLPDDIRRLALWGSNLNAPGAANFRLSYLAVKLLLRRIQLDLEKSLIHTEDDTLAASYTHAQRAAEEIVHLIQELNESDLHGFWIPVNAFTLTSATTFLLRIGLRVKNTTTRNAPLRIANDMITTLRAHRDNYGWDLADHCLVNCADLLERIGAVESGGDVSAQLFPDVQENLDIDPSILDELFMGMTGLEEVDL